MRKNKYESREGEMAGTRCYGCFKFSYSADRCGQSSGLPIRVNRVLQANEIEDVELQLLNHARLGQIRKNLAQESLQTGCDHKRKPKISKTKAP